MNIFAKLEEIRQGIADVFDRSPRSVDISKLGNGAIEITLSDYEAFSTNFGTLMTVAKVLGTLNFDINDEYEEGRVYSEWTKDSDTYIRRFVVKQKHLGEGLPWETGR